MGSREDLAGTGVRAVPVLACILLLAACRPGEKEASFPPVLPARPQPVDPVVLQLVERHVAAVQAESGSARAHGELGLVYEANLLWAEARDSFRRAASLAPGETSWRLHLAIATRMLGELPEAAALLEELVAEAPDLAPAHQRLGQVRLELGEPGAAEASFGRVTRLRPEAAAGWIGLGDSLLRQGRVEEAIPVLERAAALEPGSRAAHFHLGRAYREAGRLEEARRQLAWGREAFVPYLDDELTAAVERRRVHLTAQMNQAAALLRAGRTGEAIRLLETRRQVNPESVTLLNKLAVAYMRALQYGEARGVLEEALRLQPRSLETRVNQAWWALGTARLEEALGHASEAVSLAPGSPLGHAMLARVLERLKRLEEATASLERALALDPTDPELYLELGDLQLRQDRLGDALAVYHRALELWPGLAPIHLRVARAQLQAGRPREAARALASLRRVSPEHPALGPLEDALAGLEDGRS